MFICENPWLKSKLGRILPRPSSKELTTIVSVTVIQTKLNQPRRNNRRCDLAEGRRSTDIDDARETEDRVVPQVENIHAETKFMAFPDSRCFD